jgi:hypothetical protein
MYAVPRNKVVRAAFYQIYCVQWLFMYHTPPPNYSNL